MIIKVIKYEMDKYKKTISYFDNDNVDGSSEKNFIASSKINLSKYIKLNTLRYIDILVIIFLNFV